MGKHVAMAMIAWWMNHRNQKVKTQGKRSLRCCPSLGSGCFVGRLWMRTKWLTWPPIVPGAGNPREHCHAVDQTGWGEQKRCHVQVDTKSRHFNSTQSESRRWRPSLRRDHCSKGPVTLRHASNNWKCGSIFHRSQHSIEIYKMKHSAWRQAYTHIGSSRKEPPGHVNRWMLGHYSKPMMEGAGGTVGIVVAGSGDTRWSSNVPGREPGAIIRGSDGARMGCLRRKFKTTQTAVHASYNCSNQESYPASTVSMMLKMSLTYTASIAAMATSYCWALSL